MSAVFAQADKCEAETIDTKCNALDSQSDREECRRYHYLLCENTLTEDELKEIEALEEENRKWAAEKKRKRDEEIAKKEAERLAKWEEKVRLAKMKKERLAKKANMAKLREEFQNRAWDETGYVAWFADWSFSESKLPEFIQLKNEAFGEKNDVLPFRFIIFLDRQYGADVISKKYPKRRIGCDLKTDDEWNTWANDGKYSIIFRVGEELRDFIYEDGDGYEIEYVSADFKCVYVGKYHTNFSLEFVADIYGEGTGEDKIEAIKLAHEKIVQSMQDASDNNLELDPN